jgi:hypothetical protein
LFQIPSDLIKLLVIVWSIGFFSCQTNLSKEYQKTPIETGTPSNEEVAGQAILEKCVSAHGGFDRWQSFEGLEYTLINNGTPIYQLTQLKDRRAYLKAQDFEIGFDGEKAWARPDLESVPTKSAAVYYNLDFYFLAMPFVLKDPGVFTSYQGTTVIDGLEYETLKVTFGGSVGLTPQDIYFLYLDPTTYILKILVYSITYNDPSKGNEFNSAKVYTEYQPVQGLLMPGKMENFEWHQGKIGKSKHHVRLFEKIRFLKAIPNKTIFSAPKDAVIEEVK